MSRFSTTGSDGQQRKAELEIFSDKIIRFFSIFVILHQILQSIKKKIDQKCKQIQNEMTKGNDKTKLFNITKVVILKMRGINERTMKDDIALNA